MRNLILFLLTGLVIYSCDRAGEQYSIDIELEGSEGKWIKLMVTEDREYVVYDSVLAEPGTDVVMTKNVVGIQTMYLTLEGISGSIRLLVENADYTISGTVDDPVIKSSGRAQKDLNAYNRKLEPITSSMSEIRKKLMEAPEEEDPSMADSLREEYYKLYEKRDIVDSAYIADHPASYATILALRGTFYKLDADQLEALLDGLDPKLHQLEEYRYMSGKLERMKAVAVGQPYADFGLETPEGVMLRVSDVQNGNVLLIDFWASWCGPCRRVNPELVKIYREYNERGFEILGVSLDSDSANWVRAIADDNLTWPQISDLKYWNCEGALLYGVPAIPHTVLIDRNGIISARKLHGDELRIAIESLL